MLLICGILLVGVESRYAKKRFHLWPQIEYKVDCICGCEVKHRRERERSREREIIKYTFWIILGHCGDNQIVFC